MANLYEIDPAAINHHMRAVYQTRILVAAVNLLKVLEQFVKGPKSFERLKLDLNLKDRPAMVLFPALCAMDMLKKNAEGNFEVTDLGRFLTSMEEPNLIGYLGLGSQDPGVIEMAQLLSNDGPLDTSKGIAYVKEKDEASPMDDPEVSRYLTLALSGRARHLAPLAAKILPTGKKHLLDVAGGTGYYSYEWLRLNPEATATVFDRPQVLVVSKECLDQFCKSGKAGAESVKARVTFHPGDMLTDALPKADILLAFSLFHDWPTETCEVLAERFAAALNPEGELWVHDAFLDDSLDGPLAVVNYSTQLFSITKGRCYSRGEHFEWFTRFGLLPSKNFYSTQMDYGLISAAKP
jgi:hypothetical protein